MTAKELAREFMLGFKTNLTCPDVSPSEYEGVMEFRIGKAIADEREACARIADNAFEGWRYRCQDSDDAMEAIAAAIRARSEP